ncbi:hypothetical protein TUM20985_41560 [Mycobacterium antarcticum]|uniref:P-type ATPase n=1 Tax=Mycolicibacterium sp. TUM20985 TaxID=3023370 RepID=UPI00257246EF|nr:hypothetical protein [Mycolicibacterium sp. TUM20985]BDX33609.1 hypothetical protein TUM20985_41560 [Mycolicibacterium sp. TUM20985]
MKVQPLFLISTLVALIAGGVACLSGRTPLADGFWFAGTLVAVIPAIWWAMVGLRRGRVGVDVIAVLSLVGAMAVGEYLAGALVGLMLATGQTLDAAAERRATKDLRSLLAHAATTARRRAADGLEVIAGSAVMVNDLIVMGPGEVVPFDGRITTGSALLDDSVLTGESAPVERRAGEVIRSGAVNAGGAVEISAIASPVERRRRRGRTVAHASDTIPNATTHSTTRAIVRP